MAEPKILAFAGSTRNGSFNRQLLELATQKATAAGASVTLLDLKEFQLPIFDQDLEAAEGLPANAKRLKEIFVDHDGLMIACPEYNSSITPLLKNVIDWVSRPASPDDPSLSAYKGKTALLMAASPGGFGGLRGLRHVREILGNIGVWVSPDQFALGQADSAFEGGELKDDKQSGILSSNIEAFVTATSKQIA